MASTTVSNEPTVIPPELPVPKDLEKGAPESLNGSSTPSEQDIEKQEPESSEEPSDETVYPPAREVFVIMLSLYLAMFLSALDRTIIATAVPYITDHFHAFGDAGWYGSAYNLTSASFMLLLGRVYTFYSPKNVFLTLIVIFELGSAICGAAPNSTTFIVGRAIAGLGTAGIMNGAIVIMVHTLPLTKRPLYIAAFGAIMGISSVVGPLLGGAFTQHLSWRWCFYINLPIGAVALVVLVFVLKLPGQKKHQSLKEQINQLDPIGTFFFLPGLISLLLALQWGGSTYAWNSARIIALLVIFGVCACIFIAVQAWRGDMATVPPHILKNRSLAAAFFFSFCIGGSMMVLLYYLAIWFQAIKDASPVHSGIMSLPFLLSLVVASISAGIFVKKVGYYAPPIIASSIIMPIGAGLLTTFTPETGHAKWIGYQVIFGFGLGIGMQQANMAAQTILNKKDVSTGVSLNFFSQLVGGAIFISVAQSVLVNGLISGLSGIPGFDPAIVVNTGATEIKSVVGTQHLELVKIAYNHALTKVFEVALVLSCLTILAALAIEWKNIKTAKNR